MGALDFVNESFRFSTKNQGFELKEKSTTTYPGDCKTFIPDIRGFLPVYAFDPYPGFKVKTFPDCTEEEIETYVAANKVAIESVLRQFSIDVIQTNHAIMFPYIVSQIPTSRRPPHFIKVHGSALNLSVRTQKRLVPYAISGFESATNIFVNSEHAYNELARFLKDENRNRLIRSVHVIPAGVNVTQFPFFPNKNLAVDRCITFANELTGEKGGRSPEITRGYWQRWRDEKVRTVDVIQELRDSYDYRRPDENVPEILKGIAWKECPVIFFIGKYLWTKGIQLLLLAAPIILAKKPRAQFLFTGFGPFREQAEYIIQCLAAGNLQTLLDDKECLVDDWGNPLPYFKENLTSLWPVLERALPEVGDRLLKNTSFTGIMSHEEIKHILPAVDVLVAPSVFPESFGMVAVEAMACGIFPVLTYQSSFKEISDICLRKGEAYGLHMDKVQLDSSASQAIANNILAVLDFSSPSSNTTYQTELGSALRSIVEQNYSWQAVADHYLRHWGAE